MAVYSELDSVVDQIRTKIQSFYETLKKDSVAERLYSNKTDEAGCVESPEIESFLYSKTLDRDPSLLKSQGDGSRVGNDDKIATSPKKKVKVVNFSSTPYSKPGVSESFTFEKENTYKPTPTSAPAGSINFSTTVSALTKLLKPDSQANSSGNSLMDDVLPSMGGLTLTVHTWHPSTMKVSVFEKATVGQVISATLKQFSANKLEMPPVLDPTAYSLRIADNAGRIDDDYPALDEKQSIFKFKNEHFILCRLSQREERERAKTAAATRPKSQQLNISGGIPMVVGSPTPESMMVFKISLPNKTTTKVHYQPDLKLSELLRQICKKRVLYATEHYFMVPGTDGPCNLNLTMEQIGGNELILCENTPPASNSGGDDTSQAMRPDIFWYDGLAFQYKTYDVVKLKKYGAKQERVLGVDRDRITNMPPTNAKNSQTAKRPSRFVRDVTRVCELENKPKQFLIEYSDGKTYTYEAKTAVIAGEIVGKISYLVKSEQRPHPKS